MPETTFEEAKRCPKCLVPGKPNGVRPAADGGKLHSFLCETESCRWYNTGWAVQVNKDGSIPINEGKGPKQFVMPSFLQDAGRREVEETKFIFGYDRDPDDPEYGVQRSNDEIKKEF